MVPLNKKSDSAQIFGSYSRTGREKYNYKCEKPSSSPLLSTGFATTTTDRRLRRRVPISANFRVRAVTFRVGVPPPRYDGQFPGKCWASVRGRGAQLWKILPVSIPTRSLCLRFLVASSPAICSRFAFFVVFPFFSDPLRGGGVTKKYG